MAREKKEEGVFALSQMANACQDYDPGCTVTGNPRGIARGDPPIRQYIIITRYE